MNASVSYSLAEQIENLTLTGSTAINGTGNRLNNVLYGNTAANTLFGDAGNDVLDGKAGADTLQGGLGDDRYFLDNLADQVTELASEGLDRVYSSVSHTLTANVEALMLGGTAAINGVGNALDNLLQGNSGINTLDGAAGNDILQAAAGNDSLSDSLGNNLLDGGAGNDVLSAGAGNDFLIGGLGNDTIHTGSGSDVIAFNRGDGADVVMASAGKDNTLSLGNGIQYADLLFQKSANDLILVSGASDKITFKDWYANPANRSVANLQVVLEGSVDYDAASASVIRNQKIAQFDFDGLVAAFDSARNATPTISSWQLSKSLLDFHLASSDTAALGGDLAYQQACTGNLSHISLLPSQAILASGQFGTVAQNVQAVSALQDSSPRLL
ncbi:hypothetical protein V8J88_20390 [Massilia sp. W12]|uniref:calcium-binding protein n=1 Tax=Massilia sp. W12 TaxID=3126507 RepID=UPI0030CAA0D3